GVTLSIVIVSKFREGAWVTLLLIPAILFLMRHVRRHYEMVNRETVGRPELATDNLSSPLLVVPIERWNTIAQKALRFALTLSPDVVVVHVNSEEKGCNLQDIWPECVQAPARRAGLPVPELVM